MPVWVQLKRQKIIQHTTYHPGDWVEVGTQYAQRLVTDGEASVVDVAQLTALDGAGVAYHTCEGDASWVRDVYKLETAVMSTPNTNAFPYTLYVHTLPASIKEATGVLANPGRLGTLFTLLQTWDVLAPLHAYGTQANTHGSTHDREALRTQIHDLRVPVYDARVFGYSVGADVFLDALDEPMAITNRDMRFLSALWKAKPLFYPLPPAWGLG